MRVKSQLLAERIRELNKNLENLVRAHYQLIDMFLPEVKPTKREIEILKKRKDEPTVSLKTLKKKLR